MEERKENLGLEEKAAETEQDQRNDEWVDDAKRQADRRRSYILWLLGGAYLVYTCVSLIKGYMAGAEDVSIILLLIGIIFGGIGAALIIIALRGLMKQPGNVAAGAKAAAEEAVRREEQQPKKPSIAERARLAESLGDVEGEEDNGEG